MINKHNFLEIRKNQRCALPMFIGRYFLNFLHSFSNMFITSYCSVNLKFNVFVEENILKFENGDLKNMLKILKIFDIT